MAGKPDVLRRVKLCADERRLCDSGAGAAASTTQTAGQRGIPRLATARFKPFIETLQASKLTSLLEGKPLDKEAYRRGLAKDLQIDVVP